MQHGVLLLDLVFPVSEVEQVVLCYISSVAAASPDHIYALYLEQRHLLLDSNFKLGANNINFVNKATIDDTVHGY